MTQPCNASQVLLEVKGVEKVAWTDHVRRNDETVEEKRKAKKDVFKYKAPCFNFTGTLYPGDYTIPFSFQLPSSLPSSIIFQDKHQQSKPKAKVKYHIKALVVDASHHDLMKYKQILVIREQGEAFKTDITQATETRLSTWCCVDQGMTKLQVNFEKNVFEPNDVCKALINLDNSGCNLTMSGVRLAIEQELTLNASGHRFHHLFTLANRTEAGVEARKEGTQQRHMEVDLRTIRYTAPDHKKKKGVQKALSVEDRFMMENMAPKCSGSHVKNEYFLAVRCAFEGCVCCASMPVARVPITIVPVINPQVWSYQQPADFNPQVYQAYSFNLH